MKARFNKISSTEKLDELFNESNEQPIVIFKHSLTCPISAGVYQEISNADADINLVVVQTARNISTLIAEKNRRSTRNAAGNCAKRRKADLSRLTLRRNGGRC